MKRLSVLQCAQLIIPFVALLALLGIRGYIRIAPMDVNALAESRAGLIPAYVGAEVCGRCHQDVYESWKTTKMAHAFDVLPDTAVTDPVCLSCHTTGSGTLSKPLPGVQCESCHGPGERYVAAMARNAPLVEIREAGLIFPGLADCRRCHDERQSPNFDLTDTTRAGIHAIPKTAPTGGEIKAEPVGANRCQACHGPTHNPCPDRFAGDCEECHGPGARYVPIMAKGGDAASRREAGLIIPDRSVCTDCHEEEGVDVDIARAKADAPATAVGSSACSRCHGQKHKPCPQTTNCESCHGAGSKFVPLMSRRSPRSALIAAGLLVPEKKVCDECHEKRGITVTTPPTPSAGPTLIGAEQCLMCHSDPLPHQPCPETKDCESCHGPGSTYMEVMAQGGSADDRRAAGLMMPAKSDACDQCHTKNPVVPGTKGSTSP